jgi:hypothetical protein
MLAAARAIAAIGLGGWLARYSCGGSRRFHHFFAILDAVHHQSPSSTEAETRRSWGWLGIEG